MVNKEICIKTSKAFVQSWTNGLSAAAATIATTNNNNNNNNGDPFLAQFSQTVEWYDHAFFTKRVGPDSLARFRTDWLNAIANFGTDIISINVFDDDDNNNNKNNKSNDNNKHTDGSVSGRVTTTTSTAVIQCVYHGRMVGPLPGRLASGKQFRANVLILLKVNADGKIQRVDEYYTANLDDGVDVDSYKLLTNGGGGGKKKHRPPPGSGGVNAGKL